MLTPVSSTVEISVVAPAHNEEGNVVALADEVSAAFSPLGVSFELVYVDDGSTDKTRAIALDALRSRPWMRCIAMSRTPPGKGCGQSAAMYAGIHAARGRLIATMDADLQNNPADIAEAFQIMLRTGADFVQGDRSHARKDNAIRKFTSIIGRKFRLWFLGDSIRDTGCSLRLVKREIALALPLQFKGMHRFVPITAINLGYKVVEFRVSHRPRVSGETKYGLGIMQRGIPGFIDLLAVRWMRNRRRPVDAIELTPMPFAEPVHAQPNVSRQDVKGPEAQGPEVNVRHNGSKITGPKA
jgi:dolichol-phosphate mannosyltransferase